jgi:hypothetical protein
MGKIESDHFGSGERDLALDADRELSQFLPRRVINEMCRHQEKVR